MAAGIGELGHIRCMKGATECLDLHDTVVVGGAGLGPFTVTIHTWPSIIDALQPDDHPVAVAHLVRLVGLCPSSVITVESHIVADICIALKCFTRLATVQQLWEQPAYLYHAAQIIQDELARVEKVLKAEHGKL